MKNEWKITVKIIKIKISHNQTVRHSTNFIILFVFQKVNLNKKKKINSFVKKKIKTSFKNFVKSMKPIIVRNPLI